jgi:hypothetical protein
MTHCGHYPISTLKGAVPRHMMPHSQSRPIPITVPWNSKCYAGAACDVSSNVVVSHSVTPVCVTTPSHFVVPTADAASLPEHCEDYTVW